MMYRNSVVNIPVPVHTYDAMNKSSEKVEIIFALILSEIISDHDLYERVDRIDIKRASKETDFLSEFAYNWTNTDYIENIIETYDKAMSGFRSEYMLLREYYYHELETMVTEQTADLFIDYIFLNPMTVLVSFTAPN